MSDDDGASALAPVLDDDTQRLLATVLGRAKADGVSLATAESCTGGMLASLLTDVKGMSGLFERGYVVYSDPAKCQLLGIEPDVLELHGAVSGEIAVAMAEGALEHSEADIAVSTTGYADDGPRPGLVHFGCARRGRGTLHRVEEFGAIGRDGVRLSCVRVVLEMLDSML